MSDPLLNTPCENWDVIQLKRKKKKKPPQDFKRGNVLSGQVILRTDMYKASFSRFHLIYNICFSLCDSLHSA